MFPTFVKTWMIDYQNDFRFNVIVIVSCVVCSEYWWWCVALVTCEWRTAEPGQRWPSPLQTGCPWTWTSSPGPHSCSWSPPGRAPPGCQQSGWPGVCVGVRLWCLQVKESTEIGCLTGALMFCVMSSSVPCGGGGPLPPLADIGSQDYLTRMWLDRICRRWVVGADISS